MKRLNTIKLNQLGLVLGAQLGIPQDRVNDILADAEKMATESVEVPAFPTTPNQMQRQPNRAARRAANKRKSK